MSSGKPSKDKETEESTIKPLGKDGGGVEEEWLEVRSLITV